MKKGWNRLDYFILNNPTSTDYTSQVFTMNINPIKDQNEASPGRPALWFSRYNTATDNSPMYLGNYLKNRVELATALFPNTNKLFPQFDKSASKFIINSLNEIDLNYTISQDDSKLVSTFVNKEYYMTLTNLNQSSNISDIVDNYNSSYNYYIDSIEFINNSNIPINIDRLILYSNISEQIFVDETNFLNMKQTIHDRYTYTGIHTNIEGILRYKTIPDVLDIPHQIIIKIVEESGQIVGNEITPYQSYNIKLGIENINGNHITNSNGFYVSPEGCVGIGTSNIHNYSLYVNNVGNSNKGIFCADDITVLSSRKYKKDIRPIDNPFEKIKKLQGVMYKRSDKEGEEAEKEHMGLILEDVREVIPEVCDDNGIKYGELVALLIECIKNVVYPPIPIDDEETDIDNV